MISARDQWFKFVAVWGPVLTGLGSGPVVWHRITSMAVGPCAAARTGRVGRGQPCPGRGKAALGAPWGRPPLGLAPGDAAAALGRASPIAFLNRPPPLFFAARAGASRGQAALQIGDVGRRRRSRRRRHHFDACAVRKFEKLATPRARARIAAVAPPGPTSPSPPPYTVLRPRL